MRRCRAAASTAPAPGPWRRRRWIRTPVDAAGPASHTVPVTAHRGDGETPIQDTLAANRSVRIVILAAGYTLTGIVGLSLAVPPGYATAVWPPSGIALAAVLMWGPRVWPGIAAGSVLVNLAAALTTADTGLSWVSLVIACAIAIGSTVQALACAWAIQRWIDVSQMFETGPATLRFAGFAAAACLIAASWGVASLSLAGVLGPEQFLASWQTWWLGDLIGMLVFAPVFLTWRQSLLVGRNPWRLGELAAAFAMLAISTAAVFLTPAPAGGASSPMTFVPLPCLVWIAFRFRPNGVALAICVMSLIAVAATANGAGPFGEALLQLADPGVVHPFRGLGDGDRAERQVDHGASVRGRARRAGRARARGSAAGAPSRSRPACRS